MDAKDLIKGMEFTRDHKLVHSEIKTLIPYLSKPHTIQEVADVLGQPKTTVHHAIQRLKMRHLLVLKNKDERGTCLYQFNADSIK